MAVIIQRTGLLSSPTALRAAMPSEEMITRWCMAAPRESMATSGTPSGSPAWLIGWQIISRHPSKLGCLRVAVRFPSTRASSIAARSDGVVDWWGIGIHCSNTPALQFSVAFGRSCLVNAQIVYHDAAADAREGARVGDAFAGGGRDGVAQIALATEPEAGHARAVLNEQRGVQRSRHSGHVFDVVRMDDGGMLVIVLSDERGFDAFFDSLHPHDWDERHHLLFLHKHVVLGRLGKEQFGLVGHAGTGGFGQHRCVFADQRFVEDRFGATRAVSLFEGKRFLGQPLELSRAEADRADLLQLGHELVSNGFQHEDLLLPDAEEVVVVGGAVDDV